MTNGYRLAGHGVQTAFGRGLAAMIAGIERGECPTSDHCVLGYPGTHPPRASRFADVRAVPGEAPSRERLLETTADAIAMSGIDPIAFTQEDCGLFVGTSGFLYASTAELYWRALEPNAASGPFIVRDPGWGAALVTEQFNMQGPCLTLSTGCAASANALLVAMEMLDRAAIDRAVVLGAEGLNAVSLAGFEALMLLDPAGCRPFDRDRSGLQLGEGVGACVLERAGDHDRGVLLLGGATLCDTHHLTSATPDGEIMAAVITEALEQTGTRAQQINAIKAHGTGSVDSDRAEASAIVSVFGPLPPPVTALKRYLGHTLGACGIVETLAMIGCLEAQFIAPAAGFDTLDPELGLAPLGQRIGARPGRYLLNFFGFGGSYTALVVELR